MSPPESTLPAGHAAALGALHGPAELLPISSSGHTTLVPWLLGWPYAEADGATRKLVEVALHAGTAAALLIALRGELRAALTAAGPRRLGLATAAVAPAAIAGATLERAIEARLGTPRSIAVGLIAGALAMGLADRRYPTARTAEQAGVIDGLALGAAQALALFPGASRSGLTLAAARARAFDRPDAAALSRLVGLPVLLGAAGLKAARVARDGVPAELRGRLALTAGVAFAGTLVAARAGLLRATARPLAPFVAYRCALGGLALARAGARRRWQNGRG